MAYSAKFDNQADPYGRLLQRLTSALDEAASLARLSSEPATEMEVRGLSATELALITAYLANDHDGLRSWQLGRPVPLSPPFERHAGAVTCTAAAVPKLGTRVAAGD